MKAENPTIRAFRSANPLRPRMPSRTMTLLLAALSLPAALLAATAAAPIAATDGEMVGTRVEVIELKRDGAGTVTLKFVLYNDGGTEPVHFNTRMFGDQNVHADYGSIGGVHLIDAANRKKYLVVRDSDQNCVCSRNVESIGPGGKALLWAKFPAPPVDVKTVSVMIPHFIPMDGVPIGQ